MSLLSETGLSLERLAGFLEVVEAGSQAAAANGDLSRQALLSRQISDLEEFFGTKLFRRAGRRNELTEAGRDLATRIRESFRSLEDFQRIQKGRNVRISVGAGGSVLEWLLVPSLQSLKQEGSEWRMISSRTIDLSEQIRDGLLDFAILREDAIAKGLTKEPVGTVGYGLWVPSALFDGRTIKDDTLSSLPLAVPASGNFRKRLDAQFRKKGRQPHFAVETSSFAQCAELVRSGSFATFLPDYAGPFIRSPGIRRFPASVTKDLSRNLFLVRSSHRNDLARHQTTLAERLAENLRAAHSFSSKQADPS